MGRRIDLKKGLSGKPPTPSISEDKERLNLQIDGKLKGWAKEYVSKKNTTLTQLITDYLTELRDTEEGDGVPQI